LPDLGLEKEAKVHGCQSELGEGASEAKRWAKTNSKQKKIVGWFWFCEKRENNVATNRRLECQAGKFSEGGVCVNLKLKN
jgi:hypothetical protein